LIETVVVADAADYYRIFRLLVEPGTIDGQNPLSIDT